METDQITESIIGASYEVMNVLGSGFLEKVYENALVEELTMRHMLVVQQKELIVRYKHSIAGFYIADLLVEDEVIVELKVARKLDVIHSAQVINYLKASGFQVGLLINFGNPHIEVKRFFNNGHDKKEEESE